MILDKEDIERLKRNGITVVGPDGKLFAPKVGSKSESDLLREILQQLRNLNAKPVPSASVIELEKPDPPNVTVKPPEVTVNVPPDPPRIKVWKFDLTKDEEGRTTSITATAIK